jgi:hypothetical protein
VLPEQLRCTAAISLGSGSLDVGLTEHRRWFGDVGDVLKRCVDRGVKMNDGIDGQKYRRNAKKGNGGMCDRWYDSPLISNMILLRCGRDLWYRTLFCSPRHLSTCSVHRNLYTIVIL